MKKNKKNAASLPVAAPEQEQKAVQTDSSSLSEMSPSEELQIYYNDAYMREKQRFNDMFGIIDEPTKLTEQPSGQPTPYSQPFAERTSFYSAQSLSSGTTASAGYYAESGKKEKTKGEKKRMSGGLKILIAILITLGVLAIFIGINNTLLW